MMKKDEYIEAIEKLNREVLELTSSKEYTLGKKILELKSGKNIISKLITYIKVKKYNHPEPQINTYKEMNHVDLKNKKLVIYMVLVGNYDNIKDPLIMSENCDYVLFTDQNISSTIWKVKEIPESVLKLGNPTLINRYFKMHPHEFFNGYDYSIYLDSNNAIISELDDFIYRLNPKYGIAFHKHRYRYCIYEEVEVCRLLKKGNYKQLICQKKRYLKDKFPSGYGMLECGIIVCDLRKEMAKEIFKNWWNEFLESESMRDQIALPYILWKKDIKPEEIATLGDNRFKNEKIRIDREHIR